MRVKELVLRVGNFPRNQSAHPAGCGVGPRAERQGGRQVAAMRPLGNAAQGISKATEHVSQLSLVVRGLPHALGRSWSLYPSPKLPASSSSGKPCPLSAVWEPEQGRHPRRRLMRSQLRSPRGKPWPGRPELTSLQPPFYTHRAQAQEVHGGVGPISFLFLVPPGHELPGCQVPDCTQPPGPGRWPCGGRRWCGPLTSPARL